MPPEQTPFTWKDFCQAYNIPNHVYAVGFNWHWRPALHRFLQGASITHVNRVEKVPDRQVAVVWGQRLRPGEGQNITLVRLEDGFLRSVGLGAEFQQPLSWVADFEHLYFSARGESRLETLLASHQFTDSERARAERLLLDIRNRNISKYNLNGDDWRAPVGKEKVILVPGQVETDASIEYGCGEIRTNLALLQQVRQQNPTAWIVYKPHPDVVAGARRVGEGEAAASDYANEIVINAAIGPMLEQVDEVHTMTSLAGFEALIRHKPVTCYGLPFYAGWGLTEDKVSSRRNRELHLSELAHAVLIQYPFYVSLESGMPITPEQVLNEIQRQKVRERSWVQGWRRLLKRNARRAIGIIRRAP